MQPHLQRLILKILAENKNLNLATIRRDGWPQVTTVSFVNDGLKIYFATVTESQKLNNIGHCSKVSFTIDKDEEDWGKIQGLSVAARAENVTSPKETSRVANLLLDRFPQIRGMGPVDASAMAFVRLTPEIISILDYTRGFGHTDLVALQPVTKRTHRRGQTSSRDAHSHR
jgi:nitroimidazol reductase NimA-like FMN-containing flavoprotein (pyridoxamine 5'-phosphate oxidase superfamily)